MKSFFDFFGGRALRLNNDLGAMAIFFFRSFIMIFRIKQIPEIIAQVYFIGAKSSQIVMLVGFFTGMVLGSYTRGEPARFNHPCIYVEEGNFQADCSDGRRFMITHLVIDGSRADQALFQQIFGQHLRLIGEIDR